MRGRRTPRRAARRRSLRPNVTRPRVANHDRFSPTGAADRAAACRAGQAEPRLAILDTALPETLPWSSLLSAALSAHPLPDVRRAMQQLDALCFTRAEETHRRHVHQRHFLKVQHDRWSIASDVCRQFLQVVRLNSATQAQNGAVAVGSFLDS